MPILCRPAREEDLETLSREAGINPNPKKGGYPAPTE